MTIKGSQEPNVAPATGPASELSQDGLWQINGIHLFARDGAVLPPVDLESGSTSAPLLQVDKQCTRGHWITTLMALLGVMVLQFLPKGSIPGTSLPGWTAQASYTLFFVVLLALISRLSSSRSRFSMFVEPITEKQRNRRKHLRAFLYILSLSLVFLPLLAIASISNQTPPDLAASLIIAAAIIGAIGMIAISLWQYRDRPKLLMGLREDDWIQISGIHPSAISRLEEWKTSSRGAHEA